ncbi:hypothetical protein ACVW0P_002579 [Mucilaginibacter sp. UYNi724]
MQLINFIVIIVLVLLSKYLKSYIALSKMLIFLTLYTVYDTYLTHKLVSKQSFTTAFYSNYPEFFINRLDYEPFFIQ